MFLIHQLNSQECVPLVFGSYSELLQKPMNCVAYRWVGTIATRFKCWMQLDFSWRKFNISNNGPATRSPIVTLSGCNCVRRFPLPAEPPVLSSSRARSHKSLKCNQLCMTNVTHFVGPGHSRTLLLLFLCTLCANFITIPISKFCTRVFLSSISGTVAQRAFILIPIRRLHRVDHANVCCTASTPCEFVAFWAQSRPFWKRLFGIFSSPV